MTIGGVELTLDEQICSEALILSDVFNLPELEAVDLILAGEAQKIHFEGLNRGLIGVICYYDAHRWDFINKHFLVIRKFDKKVLKNAEWILEFSLIKNIYFNKNKFFFSISKNVAKIKKNYFLNF